MARVQSPARYSSDYNDAPGSSNEPFDPLGGVVTTDRIYSQNDDNSDTASDLEAYVGQNRDPQVGDVQGSMINQYVIEKVVGKGRHGVVMACHVSGHNDRILAMKIVPRDTPDARQNRKYQALRKPLPQSNHLPVVDRIHTVENQIRKEIAIMKKCRHPHVVRLFEVIDDRQTSSIYMIMEYLGGGEIKWKEGDQPVLSLDQSRRIMRDAILGLEYLHHQGIIHRDIKPANLVWSKNREHVKIADFGVAHFSYAQRLAAGGTEIEDPEDPVLLGDADLAKRAGSPSFIAPEVVFDHTEGAETIPNTSRPPVTKALDIWALGVTLYCFLFGRLPFQAPTDVSALQGEMITYRLVCNEDWAAPPTMGFNRRPTGGRHPPDDESEGAFVIHLLDHCLEKDPRLRITLEEIKGSPWFLYDLPNPNNWLRATAPAQIAISATETSDAMSTLRFRWGGIIITKISSILQTVRPRRSRDHVPSEALEKHAVSLDSQGRRVNRHEAPSVATIGRPSSSLSRSFRKDKGKQKDSGTPTSSASKFHSASSPAAEKSMKSNDPLSGSGSHYVAGGSLRGMGKSKTPPQANVPSGSGRGWKHIMSWRPVKSPPPPTTPPDSVTTRPPSPTLQTSLYTSPQHDVAAWRARVSAEVLRGHLSTQSSSTGPLTDARRTSSWGDHPKEFAMLPLDPESMDTDWHTDDQLPSRSVGGSYVNGSSMPEDDHSEYGASRSRWEAQPPSHEADVGGDTSDSDPDDEEADDEGVTFSPKKTRPQPQC